MRLLLVALALVAAPADAAPRHRHGRVVRIERPRRVEPDPVRLCMLTSPDEGKMMCYGQTPPLVGSALQMVSDSGVRGSGVVRDVGPSAFDPCRLGSAHDVTVEASGGLVSPAPTSYVVALQGVALGDDARLLPNPQIASPGRRDLEQVWIALDRDGDSAADWLTVVADCSGEVRSLPLSANGQRVTPYCIDYWLDDGSGWNRAGRDIFYQCM